MYGSSDRLGPMLGHKSYGKDIRMRNSKPHRMDAQQSYEYAHKTPAEGGVYVWKREIRQWRDGI